MLFAFGCRSNDKTFLELGPWSNLNMSVAIVVSGTLQLGTVFLPFGRSIFQTTEVSNEQWVFIALVSLFPITVVEVAKLVRRGLARGRRADTKLRPANFFGRKALFGASKKRLRPW
jgi:Ca2+-transporting ATPase